MGEYHAMVWEKGKFVQPNEGERGGGGGGFLLAHLQLDQAVPVK